MNGTVRTAAAALSSRPEVRRREPKTLHGQVPRQLIPSTPSLRAVVLSIVALIGVARMGAAQGIVAVRVEVDNDYFTFWVPQRQRTDEDYTHGLRVTLDVDRAPWWGRRFVPTVPSCARLRTGKSSCLSTSLAVGQEIYTPEHDTLLPLPGERPYAGWLYVAATARVTGDAGSQELSIQFGVTGPPSLAEVVQTSFHRFHPRFSPDSGWRHQLAFEPGVLVAYNRSHLLLEQRLSGVRVLDLTPHWGMVVGNVRTGAHVGVRARLGYNVPRLATATGRRGGRPMELYGVAAVRGRWIARDLFLDGNTFRASTRVEKYPFVSEAELGGGVRFRSVTLEYRAIFPSRQYQTEPEPHSYGSIIVTIDRAH